MKPSRYLKAAVSAVIAGLTSAQVALDSGHPVTMTQWVTLGVGTLVAVLGVWAVPNAPAPTPVSPPIVPPVA